MCLWSRVVAVFPRKARGSRSLAHFGAVRICEQYLVNLPCIWVVSTLLQ